MAPISYTQLRRYKSVVSRITPVTRQTFPSHNAIVLVDDVINHLSDADAALVAISGKQNSAFSLNLGSRFMSSGGLTVRFEGQS